MIGRQVGEYVLTKLLGRGGMGEVYRAHDQRLGRDVAIKIVREPHDAAARERFRREARSLARLNHPAIVPIYHIIEQDDGDWLVMALADGMRMDEMLLDGPVTPKSALDYGWQIACGLVESHEKGILHRDLKTENVIVTPEDQVRILDFGLARPLSARPDDPSITKSGQILGTARAMSPEQARGLAIDERSDLFSLGVLLYEIVVGESPFADTSTAATLVRVCTHHQKSAHSQDPIIPRPFSELIDELLAKAPEMRPQSAAEVAERLQVLRLEVPEGAQARQSTARRLAETADTQPVDVGSDESTQDCGADNEQGVSDASSESETRPVGAGSGADHGSWFQRGAMGLGVSALALVLIGYLATNYGIEVSQPATPLTKQPVARTAALSSPSVPAVSHSYELLETGRALLVRWDRKGAIDQAVATFKALCELEPESAVAYAGLAHAYFRQYSETHREDVWLNLARAAAGRALALDRHLAWAHLAQARVERLDGQNDAAKRSLEHVLELDPNEAHAYLEHGHLYQAAGAQDKAERAFRQALERAPEDREILDYLGSQLYQRGRLEEAGDLFRKSIKVAPDCAFGYRNLGAVLQAKNRFEEAASTLQKGLEINPHPSLYGNLGVLYYIQGFYPKAANAFQKALDLSGSSHDYRPWADLADCYRLIPGREAKAKEAYTIAIRLLRDELTKQPDNLHFRSRLALFLARDGNIIAAVEVLNQLRASEHPLDSDVHYIATLAYELCGDRASALSHLRSAIKEGFALVEIEREPDLVKLRGTPDYQRVLEQAARRPSQ